MSEQDEQELISEEEARQWVLDELTRGRTQADIARSAGVSGAYLNLFIKEKCSNPTSVIEKVSKCKANETQRKLSPKAPDFTTTSISKKVLDAIEYCNLLQVGGVIYGDAGVGKTMSIRQYAKTNPLCICITASPVFSTVPGINMLLAQEMGCKGRNSKQLYLEFIDRLKGSNRILIIDEAQQLSKEAIDHIRSLGDATHIGYCFIGNPSLYKTIQGNGDGDFDQVKNRMALPEMVLTTNISKDDIESIFKEAKLDEESKDFLYKVSRTSFAIRGAVNLYVAVVALYEEVTLENLKKIAAKMRITVGR